jgi:hypothetical protein
MVLGHGDIMPGHASVTTSNIFDGAEAYHCGLCECVEAMRNFKTTESPLFHPNCHQYQSFGCY